VIRKRISVQQRILERIEIRVGMRFDHLMRMEHKRLLQKPFEHQQGRGNEENCEDCGMKKCDRPWKIMGSRPRMPLIDIGGD
jgi:hypothetical protein